MKKLLEENNNNATQIAKILGNGDYRPFISSTVGGSSKLIQNIYISFDKMNKIRVL